MWYAAHQLCAVLGMQHAEGERGGMEEVVVKVREEEEEKEGEGLVFFFLTGECLGERVS